MCAFRHLLASVPKRTHRNNPSTQFSLLSEVHAYKSLSCLFSGRIGTLSRHILCLPIPCKKNVCGSEALVSIPHCSLLRRVLISMAACSIELVSEIFRNFSDKMLEEKKELVRSECCYFYEGLFWLGSVRWL